MPFSLFGSVKRPWVVTLGSVCLVCTALLAGGFFYAGRLLVIETSPHQADVGVVLAGNFSRAVYAADLYHQGLITKIWITRPVREGGAALLDELGVPYPRQEDMSVAVLQKKGVPADRIELIGNNLASTLDEAKLLARLLETKPALQSVLIITTRVHVRRAEAIFRHAFRSSPHVSVWVVGSPYDGFVEDRWWSDRDSARQVVLEVAKLVLFWVATEI